jgi:hypothetical protein
MVLPFHINETMPRCMGTNLFWHGTKDMRLYILFTKSNGWKKKSEEISKCSHNSEHKLVHSISTENNYCGSYCTDSLHWDERVLGLLEKD